MTVRIQRAEYFHTTVRDKPGEAYRLLSQLAESAVNLLAFNAVPTGEKYTQLVLFPENADQLVRTAEDKAIALSGPMHAFLISGDDKLGALVGLHSKLFDANINVYASSGVTADSGSFGYVVWVREEDFESAANVLGI